MALEDFSGISTGITKHLWGLIIMGISEAFKSVEFTLPSLEIFKIPPRPLIRTPLVPLNTPLERFFRPLHVNPRFFDLSLNPEFVFTFVAVYVTFVALLNQFNSGRQYKPWALTKTSTFKAFMLAHNALLALFSAWVYCGIVYYHYDHWKRTTSGLEGRSSAHVVEFLCQLDSRDYRILAKPPAGSEERVIYMYWVFYLSKFYEVVDTLIILARGKKSSTLQTFHHAGVIIIGWTGLRYESPMAPPGAMLNAMVHTLMYFYFTLQTLRIPVSKGFKRALTRVQIAQFIVGLGFAHFYLFVSYKAPMLTGAPQVAMSFEANGQASNTSTGMTSIPCLGNQGEGFPLVVASSYLLPLIYLFVEFYIKSYTVKAAKTTRDAEVK